MNHFKFNIFFVFSLFFLKGILIIKVFSFDDFVLSKSSEFITHDRFRLKLTLS